MTSGLMQAWGVAWGSSHRGLTPPYTPVPLPVARHWENYRSANEMGKEMAGSGEVEESQPEREKLAWSLIHCFQKSS